MYGTRRFCGDRGGLGGGGSCSGMSMGTRSRPAPAGGGGGGVARMQSHAHPSRAAWTGRSSSPPGGGQPRGDGLRTLAGPRASFACGPGCSASAQLGSASALHMVSRCWESRADHANAAPHPSPTLRLSPLGRRKGEADCKLPGTPQPRGESTTPSGGGDLRNHQPTTDHDRFHHSQLR